MWHGRQYQRKRRGGRKKTWKAIKDNSSGRNTGGQETSVYAYSLLKLFPRDLLLVKTNPFGLTILTPLKNCSEYLQFKTCSLFKHISFIPVWGFFLRFYRHWEKLLNGQPRKFHTIIWWSRSWLKIHLLTPGSISIFPKIYQIVIIYSEATFRMMQ